MNKEKYYYKRLTTRRHKKFPFSHHDYLFMRTNEYEVLIHTWEDSCPYGPPVDIEGGSRIVIRSRISGASLELLTNAVHYSATKSIERLLKTKDRNREIFGLELKLQQDFTDIYDCPLPNIHEMERGDRIYWSGDLWPSYV